MILKITQNDSSTQVTAACMLRILSKVIFVFLRFDSSNHHLSFAVRNTSTNLIGFYYGHDQRYLTSEITAIIGSGWLINLQLLSVKTQKSNFRAFTLKKSNFTLLIFMLSKTIFYLQPWEIYDTYDINC